MNDNHTRVTVKRIEKAPSQFYVQKPYTAACAKVKEKVAASLLTKQNWFKKVLSFRCPVDRAFFSSKITVLKNRLQKSKAAVKTGLSALGQTLWEKTKNMAFSGVVSIGVVAVACAVLAATCSLGCAISVNGKTVGVVKDKTVYNRLVEEINRELAYVSEEGFVPKETDLSIRLIPKGAYSAEADVKEQLKATNADMLPAYAVYAGEELLFALANEATALSVLEQYKENFTNGDDGSYAVFCEDVTVSNRFVPKKSLKTEESALAALSAGRIEVHQLAEDETLTDVAAKYNVTLEDLLKINPISNPDAPTVARIKIQTGAPLLSVKTVTLKTIEEEIPFDTLEKEDAAAYKGTVTVEQAGVPGVRVVEAYVTAVNGKETARQVVSETVLSAKVDEVVKKGTKERPSHIGTGNLSVPTSGSLSSRFGSRWGRNHTGIDLSAPVGTAVYAADNGTVIYAAYNNGGYGYLLQIDHGNGIVTYYAHCSELLVPEGTVVSKGDLIARVGNTGRSTGAHLHFEVRVNGSPVNPTAYLKDLG